MRANTTWKKALVTLGATPLLLAGITACGSAGATNKSSGSSNATNSTSSTTNQKVALTFWTLQLGTFKPYIQGVIKRFEAQHPNVTVNWVDVPGKSIQEKYQAAYAAGKAPDLANLDYGDFSTMQNEFAPLNDDLTSAQINNFPSAAISPYKVNGTLYAIPFYDAGTSLPNLYNMALLNKAGITKVPTTQAELFADGAKLHKADPNAYFKIGGAESVSKGNTGEAALQAYSVPIFSSDFKKTVFATSQGVTVWDKYKQGWKDGVYDPDSVGNANGVQLFLQGTIAQFGGGLQSDLTKSWGPIKKDVAVGPPIYGPAGTFQAGPTFFWVVSKTSKHPKLAAQLAMEFESVKSQLAFNKATKGDVGPVTNDAIKDKAFYSTGSSLQQKYAQLQAESMKHGVYVNNPLPGDVQNQVQQAIQKQFDSVLLQGKDTKTALQDAQTAANKVLSAYWSKKG